MENNVITSVQNARVKHVVALQQKSSLRREEGLFVLRVNARLSTASLVDTRWWKCLRLTVYSLQLITLTVIMGLPAHHL